MNRCLAILTFFLLAARAGAAEPTAISTPAASTPTPIPVAQGEASFGLTWLSSSDAVRAQGVALGQPAVSRYGDSFVVAEVPLQLPDQTYTVLSFGYDDQLVRITAAGGAFPNDRDLRRVRARYRELAAVLAKKYGSGREERHDDERLIGDRAAIALTSKKSWQYTVFSLDGVHIELSIFAESGTKTSWRLVVEHIAGMQKLDAERRRREEEAL